jgi:DNA-binding transcriptional ArsR family regulator
MTVGTVGTLSPYLIDLSPPSGNESTYLLVRCPICDDYLDVELTRPSQKVVDDHIATHDPAELGLGEGDRQYQPFADIMMKAHGLSPRSEGDNGANFRHREPEYETFDLDGEAVAEAVGVVDEQPYRPTVAKCADVVGVLAEIEPAGNEEIAEHLDIATATVQQHTNELEAAGWLTSERDGHRKLYSLAVDAEVGE